MNPFDPPNKPFWVSETCYILLHGIMVSTNLMKVSWIDVACFPSTGGVGVLLRKDPTSFEKKKRVPSGKLT